MIHFQLKAHDANVVRRVGEIHMSKLLETFNKREPWQKRAVQSVVMVYDEIIMYLFVLAHSAEMNYLLSQ